MKDLANEIAQTLKQYTAEVEEELEKAKDEVSKDAVKQLKANSPKNTGKYAKGWTRKKQGKGYVIHNRRYQLTHLLEHGHAKRGGGRVSGIPHIRPVEQSAIESFVEKVERAIKG